MKIGIFLVMAVAAISFCGDKDRCPHQRATESSTASLRTSF